LAEGVEFLEKYAHFDQLEAPIGGRGRNFFSAQSDFDPAALGEATKIWHDIRCMDLIDVFARCSVEIRAFWDGLPGGRGSRRANVSGDSQLGRSLALPKTSARPEFSTEAFARLNERAETPGTLIVAGQQPLSIANFTTLGKVP
jgi:hypothetical protein